MTPNPVDGQWLDFYALLDVPVGAEEDTIRKRIGKVYSEAAANSDHRDLKRRQYFQSLVERVLPQCRRVLLDPEWRAKYDRQHILNANGDPSAQNYVAFVASMRGKDANTIGEEALPQRVQDDINIARAVVECAWQGTQLELLPSKAVSKREDHEARPSEPTMPEVQNRRQAPVLVTAPAAVAPLAAEIPMETAMEIAAPQKIKAEVPKTVSAPPVVAARLVAAAATPAPFVEESAIQGEEVRATVITAQEAAEIRRRRASNPDGEAFSTSVVGDGSLAARRSKSKSRKGPKSRFSVGDAAPIPRGRLISPTSMNLMVAIVGVLLTISIQRFASTPAIATSAGRTPIFVAVSPEMESSLLRAESGWEKTPEGSRFDLVVQSVSSRDGLKRVLKASSTMPDAWIPSDATWVELYNQKASSLKRETIAANDFIAQSPMVLLARSERAGTLRQLFPNHQITSWSALRGAVARGAAGHLGLSNPQKTESGALARFSMAREWGSQRGLSPAAAAKRSDFWKWMAGFEDNAPSAMARTGDMVKDMAQGTTGRFWWVVAYESDALNWMSAGKKLEIYYLPRTTYANHPFCALERVGASGEVAQGRASFQKYLRSEAVQKRLLDDGFRPTEVSLKLKTSNNPFLNANFRSRGARIEGLPMEERSNAAATESIAQQWGKRYG